MNKKIISSLIILIFGCIAFLNVYSYNLSDKDKNKWELITNKIESLISKKWKQYRSIYIDALKKLQKKYSSNAKINTLVWYVIIQLKNSENDLESMFLEENNIEEQNTMSNNSTENQDLKDLYSYRVANEWDYKVLYLSKKHAKAEIKIDFVDWEINNVFFEKNLLIYDWISTWWMIKKVFDVNKMKEISKMRWWNITTDKKFIYSCEESWYGPWSINSFNLSTWKYSDIYKKVSDVHKAFLSHELDINENLDYIQVRNCSFVNGEVGPFLKFQLFNSMLKNTAIDFNYYLNSGELVYDSTLWTEFYDKPDENKISYQVKNDGMFNILYLLKNGKSIKIDEYSWDIVDVSIINNFLIYDLVFSNSNEKVIFDISQMEKLGNFTDWRNSNENKIKFTNGKFTSDNKFIYSCNKSTQDMPQWEMQAFDLSIWKLTNIKQLSTDTNIPLNNLEIISCWYIYDPQLGPTLDFEVHNPLLPLTRNHSYHYIFQTNEVY